MSIHSPIITQISSLVSLVNGTSSFTESMAEFEEDIVVPLRDYFYSKSSKGVVRKGRKRSKDQGGLEATSLGAFTGENLDVVNTLNMEID